MPRCSPATQTRKRVPSQSPQCKQSFPSNVSVQAKECAADDREHSRDDGIEDCKARPAVPRNQPRLAHANMTHEAHSILRSDVPRGCAGQNGCVGSANVQQIPENVQHVSLFGSRRCCGRCAGAATVLWHVPQRWTRTDDSMAADCLLQRCRRGNNAG